VDVQWIADTAIEPGGCLVLSPRRLVDGRVDEALVNLYDRLRQP
jgi:flagellar biosynthesis/type III secretory pathway protein FliH